MAVTGIGGQQLETIADKYVYTALELIAVAVCAARVVRRREDRVAWALMTGALIAWTGGDLVWTVWLDGVANPPYPSIADVLYLAMYPAVYVAMMLLIRSRLRNAGAAQWLDGGVVGLTIASVGAALVFDSVLTAEPGPARRGDRQRRLSGRGLRAADLRRGCVFARRVASRPRLAAVRCRDDADGRGRHHLQLPDGDLDVRSGDAVGRVVAAVDGLARARRVDADRPPGARPGGRAPHDRVDADWRRRARSRCWSRPAFAPICPLAVALAGAALVLAGVRGAMTYLENVRILRRNAHEASTDPLSGLGNRRRLMGDLELAFAAARSEARIDAAVLRPERFQALQRHASGMPPGTRCWPGSEHGYGPRSVITAVPTDSAATSSACCSTGAFRGTDPLVAAATQALFERGSGFAVTSSVGIAILPDDAASPSAALALADERMYADKAGRSSSSRAQTRDTRRQLLSERAHGLGGASGGCRHARSGGREPAGAGRRGAGCGAAGGRAARHRQARDPGRDPQQGGAADRVRMALHAPAPADRGADPRARRRRCARSRGSSVAARALGRERLPRRHLRGRDPARGADRRGLRRLRGDDVAPSATGSALTEAEAIAELRRGAGSQFDPHVVEAVCTALGEPLAGLSDRGRRMLAARIRCRAMEEGSDGSWQGPDVGPVPCARQRVGAAAFGRRSERTSSGRCSDSATARRSSHARRTLRFTYARARRRRSTSSRGDCSPPGSSAATGSGSGARTARSGCSSSTRPPRSA